MSKTNSTTATIIKYLLREQIFNNSSYKTSEIATKLGINKSYLTAVLNIESHHIKLILPLLNKVEKILKIEKNYFLDRSNKILKKTYHFDLTKSIHSLYSIKYKTVSSINRIEVNRQNVLRNIYKSHIINNSKDRITSFVGQSLRIFNLFINGKSINNKVFITFNEILNLPIDWHIQELVKENVEGSITEEDRFYIKYLNADILDDFTNILKLATDNQEQAPVIQQEIEPEKTFQLRQYSVWASAGIGIANENIEYDILTLPINAFLSKYDVNKNQIKNLHALIVSGDSMVPIINDEQRIYVDTSIKQVSSDGIYLIRKDNELFVKSANIYDDGSVEFYSQNSSYRNEDKKLNDQSVYPIEVLGKVLDRRQ